LIGEKKATGGGLSGTRRVHQLNRPT